MNFTSVVCFFQLSVTMVQLYYYKVDNFSCYLYNITISAVTFSCMQILLDLVRTCT